MQRWWPQWFCTAPTARREQPQLRRSQGRLLLALLLLLLLAIGLLMTASVVGEFGCLLGGSHAGASIFCSSFSFREPWVERQPGVRLAVVTPFTADETWKFIYAWTHQWLQFPPCAEQGANSPHAAFHAALILVFLAPAMKDGHKPGWWPLTNDTLQMQLQLLRYTLAKEWNALPHRHCFAGGMQVFSVPEHDRGDRISAPAHTLSRLLLSQGYQHFLRLQPDVQPVSARWLHKLAQEAITYNVNRQRWWYECVHPPCLGVLNDSRVGGHHHTNNHCIFCTHQSATCCGDAESAPRQGGKQSIHIVNQNTSQTCSVCRELRPHECVPRAEPSAHLVCLPSSFQQRSRAMVSEALTRQRLKMSAVQQEKFVAQLELGELQGEEDMLRSFCVDAQISHHPSMQMLCDSPGDTGKRTGPPTINRPLSKSDQLAIALSTPWAQRWPGRYYLYSSDFHAGPTMCNAAVYRALGLVAHLEVDYENCRFYGVCKDRLEVLSFDDWRGFSLDPCPHQLRQRFFEAYRRSAEMQRVDIVTCSHPAANCELYMPLNKSLIVFATTRIEFGRADTEVGWRRPIIFNRSEGAKVAAVRWREWVHNLRLIASSSRNLIAANSVYDQLYIQHYTGLDNVRLLPSLCKATDAALLTYAPCRVEFVVGPSRDNLEWGPNCTRWHCNGTAQLHPLWQQLQDAMQRFTQRTGVSIRVERLRDLYPTFQLQNVLNHRAVIVFPYQSSTMLTTELYRANIPLLAPSLRFLLQWDRNFSFLFERIYGFPERLSDDDAMPAKLDSIRPSVNPNPNAISADSLEFWVGLFDVFHFPHVIHFDSFDELVQLLHTTDFHRIHQEQRRYNLAEELRIVQLWKDAFSSLRINPPGQASAIDPTVSINEQLQLLYPGQKIWPVENRKCLSGTELMS